MWPPHTAQGDGEEEEDEEEEEEAAPQGKPVLSEQETRALQLLSGRAAVDVLVDALKQLPDSAAVCAKACEMMREGGWWEEPRVNINAAVGKEFVVAILKSCVGF